MKQYLVPSQLRAAIRAGAFTGRIPGQCPGFVQANLAILPAEYADSFAQFAAKNAKACPILERLPADAPRGAVRQADAGLLLQAQQLVKEQVVFAVRNGGVVQHVVAVGVPVELVHQVPHSLFHRFLSLSHEIGRLSAGSFPSARTGCPAP